MLLYFSGFGRGWGLDFLLAHRKNATSGPAQQMTTTKIAILLDLLVDTNSCRSLFKRNKPDSTSKAPS